MKQLKRLVQTKRRSYRRYPLNFSSHPFWLDVVSCIVLAIITTVIYSYFITAPRDFLLADAPRYNGYQAAIIKYSLTHFGQFAFWDQLLSSGTSWLSHPGGPQFSSLTYAAILLFGHPYQIARFLAYTHIVLAAIAFYALLRVVSVSRLTSFFVTIPYIANRYVSSTGFNGWLEEFFGIFLFPITVLCLWRALEKKSIFFAVAGAFFVAMHFFENTYYVFHYNVIVLLWISGCFALRYIWQFVKTRQKRSFQPLLSLIATVGIFWVVFVGISAIKVFPLLEFRSLSVRNTTPLRDIETEGSVMTFQFLKELLEHMISERYTPGAFNTPHFTNWVNLFCILFIGLTIMFFVYKRRFVYGVFVGLLGLGMWAYLANRMPLDLYAFFYYFLPGFNSNMFPFRFITIIHFAFFVCVALGLDLLVQHSRLYVLKIAGIMLGLVMVLSPSIYIFTTHKLLIKEFYKPNPVMKALKTNYNMRIDIANKAIAPRVSGDIPENLLVLLSKIVGAYAPEGRVYSTFLTQGSTITAVEALTASIPIVHHSYEAIMPSYQYSSIKYADDNEPLETTIKRYKILSVLNARFQIQQKEHFEFPGCEKLSLLQSQQPTPLQQQPLSDKTCQFLESRLLPVYVKDTGGIYFDSQVLAKVSLLPKPILVISDNRFNDFSALLAKQLLFHPNFDEKTYTVLTGTRTHIDDYTLEELQQFQAIILISPKVKNQVSATQLLARYSEKGGKVLTLSGSWHNYDNLQKRSASIYSGIPAWQYTPEESEQLHILFIPLPNSIVNLGNIVTKQFTPEKLAFTVETKADNVAFQFSDTYYPGWKASVDGVSQPVYMADGLVKAVMIPKSGRHEVIFTYSPDSFKKGAAVTLLTVVLLVVLPLSIKRGFAKKA